MALAWCPAPEPKPTEPEEKTSLKMKIRIGIVATALLLIFAITLQPTRTTGSKAAAVLDDWPMFLHDVARSSFNSAEVRLSATNAPNLKLKWQFQAGPIAAQPIIVGDSVYIGSWDGYLYALDRETGTQRWKLFLGNTVGHAGCYPQSAGITSAPDVVNGIVYIGGGDRYKYAIDAKTGTPIWRFDAGDNSPDVGAYNWDSPAVFNGHVYTGVASFCDRPFVQGKMWALNALTGAIDKQVNFVPDGDLGGGIWTSPTIDPATGAVYVTTGSADRTTGYAYCIAVCDPNTLAVLSAWKIPASEQVTDGDWSTTPTLFKHKDGRTLVGAAAKNGIYYVFDSNRIGDGPIWKYQVAYGGECPKCGEGSIASSAYAYDTVFTAGGRTTVNGQDVGAAVRAHDPSTGEVKWEHATAGAIFGSVVVANHLVFITADQELQVLDAQTGQMLWEYKTPARMYAAPSVAGGVLYAADMDGNFYAFSAGPYVDPTGTPAPAASTPQPTPDRRIRPSLRHRYQAIAPASPKRVSACGVSSLITGRIMARWKGSAFPSQTS